MAIRAKARNNQDRYLELIVQFPLRPIRTEEELAEAIRQVDSLIDMAVLDRDEKDYLEVLGGLVEQYEKETHPIEVSSDGEIIRHLLDAKGTTQAQVAEDCGIAESTISEILSGKRKLNRVQIGKLSHYFSVPPGVFAFGK
jgi:HTH-type transcriptional regulator / antitoxin HigA